MGMGMGSDDSDVMDLTRNIMMVSVIALFIIVIFLGVLHLYSRWYWYRRRQTALADHRQPRGGLDASFLKIIEFHPRDFEHGVECAICLSELEEGDKARILPKCHHGFHMECIDMWFHSHSTCPICRDQISQQQQSHSHSHSPSPTDDDDDVFMNDNHHQEEHYSSSSSSLQETGIRPDLVIDIAAAQHNQEEEVSPSSSTRCSSGMRSFKRIFSPGSSSNPKSCPLTP